MVRATEPKVSRKSAGRARNPEGNNHRVLIGPMRFLLLSFTGTPTLPRRRAVSSDRGTRRANRFVALRGYENNFATTA